MSSFGLIVRLQTVTIVYSDSREIQQQHNLSHCEEASVTTFFVL